MEKEKLIEQIINLEWHAFQHVQNEGGRAACQDNKITFYIMRKSQYLCWPKYLLESYMEDFLYASSKGRNLVAEKYARMEEITAPDRFENLKHLLPSQTDEQKKIIKAIAAKQSRWAAEFYSKNPEIARRSRSIDTDSNGFTSSETYLIGELGTYSLSTLKLYNRWMEELQESEINPIRETVKNTIRLFREAADL